MTYSVYDLFIVDCLYKNEFSHVVTIYTEEYCVDKELINLCNSLWIFSLFFSVTFLSPSSFSLFLLSTLCFLFSSFLCVSQPFIQLVLIRTQLCSLFVTLWGLELMISDMAPFFNS